LFERQDLITYIHVNCVHHPHNNATLSLHDALPIWLHRRKKFRGQVILTYAVLYAIMRFLVEFVRDDPRGDILGLTTRIGLSTSSSEEHTSELQSRRELVCRLLLEKKNK